MVLHPDFVREPNQRAMTVDQVVEYCTTQLKPEDAVRIWDTGNWRACVVSPLFEQIIDPRTNAPIDLKRDKGRYATIYGRVSTMAQRGDEHDDGYSFRDQIRSGIIAAILRGHAFRVYSDAGLSGFYTTNDPVLIASVRRKHAEFYTEAFEQVVLRNAEAWNTTKQIADMCMFLEHHVRAIEIGEKEALKEWQEKQTDRDWSNTELIFALRYQHHKGVRFRPGLHALVEDIASMHTIYVTDPDRLSRNQALLLSLADIITQNKIQVVSSEGIVGWMHGKELQDHLIGIITAHTAQETIRKVKRRVLGGLVEMLRAGRPHSTLPFYLERDSSGYARRVESKWPLICRVAELGKMRPHLGEARIASILLQEGWSSPTKPDHPKRELRRQRRREAGLQEEKELVISSNSVGHWLRNPLLFGSQVMLGREWPLRGSVGQDIAIMSREEFWGMHRKRQLEAPGTQGRPSQSPAICNKFIFCPCGKIIRLKKGYKGHSTPDRYRCTCSSTERKNETIRHALFIPSELDAFFTELVFFAPHLFEGTDESSNDLAAQEIALQNHLEQQREEARQKAQNEMSGISLPHTDPAYQNVLKTLIAALIHKEEQEYREAMERISRARIQQAARETLRAQRLKNQITDIRNISADQQNIVLRSYIQEVRISAELNSMTIILHNEGVLPIVKLHIKKSLTSSALVCHVPTVTEYLANIRAA